MAISENDRHDRRYELGILLGVLSARKQGSSAAPWGLANAKIVMNTVNFADIEPLQRIGNWATLSCLMANSAVALERAGAECIVLCTNTMHKVADGILDATPLPLLHIGDCTAHAIQDRGMSSVGLLGTRFTMEDGFYQGHLAKYGIRTLTPPPEERRLVHDIIYNRLCQGIFTEEDRVDLIGVMTRLLDDGGGAVVLGCTELGLLLKPEHVAFPLLDTTEIHVQSAVDFALATPFVGC